MSHPDFNITFANPVIKGLACAALTPGLRSILVFDAPYMDLNISATILAQMLECVTGRAVKQVHIGVSELDDDLWGSFVLSHEKNDSPVIWHRGTLAEAWNDPCLRLVVIPDLAKLSLAAARSCIMLVSADVAHLERHGQSERWQPNICWLAGCARSEVGRISPHLLDRFTLRLTWHHLDRPDSASALLKQILNDNPAGNVPPIALPSSIQEQLQKAAQDRATLSDETLTHILNYTSTVQASTLRRELALARLTQAVAQLENAHQVTVSHIDAAARLIGLSLASQRSDEISASPTPQLPDTPVTEHDFQPQASPEPLLPSSSTATAPPALPSLASDETTYITEPVYAPDQTVVLDTTTLSRAHPHPEDSAPIEREVASLQFPQFRYARASSGRGAVIGVERTNNLCDLALVNTLFAAAAFQPIRRKYRGVNDHRILLSPADLRSYRREPVAEQMLMLLLDYTCLRECEWQQALLPYLHWAYTERASITIVQVGTTYAANELQAELVSARSILVPSIAAALEAPRGKATPLAHGLDLALRTLHHALEHGRNTVRRVLFVVVSDGRGNIPLEASRKRQIVRPINREGIEDALQVAQRIRDLKDVQTILLNPQPRYYPDLPLALAHSLGAKVENIQRPDIAEVERG